MNDLNHVELVKTVLRPGHENSLCDIQGLCGLLKTYFLLQNGNVLKMIYTGCFH